MTENTGESIQCPICRHDGASREKLLPVERRSPNGGIFHGSPFAVAYQYKCSTCGQFIVDRDDLRECLEDDEERMQFHDDRYDISALLREQGIRGLPPFLLQFRDGQYPSLAVDRASIPIRELLARCPRTVPERLDRALCNLARMSPEGGHAIDGSPHDFTLWFARSHGEAKYHWRALEALRHIERSGNFSQDFFGVVVTPCGWARVDELERGRSSPENPAFVAMWFGNEKTAAEMSDLYAEGIEPAIRQAGYRATRVDLEEHNDYIMDKVLADIRLAPFVVADLTGHRNGVYFEAGFGRGLGIQVIHTCKGAAFDETHFDTQQVNTIRWDEPADLCTKLYHRIIRTMGKGPHPVPDES